MNGIETQASIAMMLSRAGQAEPKNAGVSQPSDGPRRTPARTGSP